jgi:uncharacterized membrane protein HdeD (DUF308 family)
VDEEIALQTRRLYESAKPWRADLPWWLILVEGIAALAAGLYILLADNARQNIFAVIAVVLMLYSVLQFMAGLRDSAAVDPMSRYRLIRGGIGLMAGFLILLDRFEDYLSDDAARVVLGLGFLGIGVAGLWGMITHRRERDDRLGAYVVDGILALYGIAMLLGAAMTGDTNDLFAWLLVIAGALLLAFALVRRSRAMTA